MADTSPPEAQTDKPPRRALILPLAFFAVLLTIFIIGKIFGFADLESLQHAMDTLSASPFALPIVILIFCICAFIGVPQFALIAIMVAAFGPVLGAAYSWIATMFSGSLTFYVGRFAGEKTLRRYAGNSINKLSQFVGRNAFIASAMVRIIPTGPFLTANMAFGVSHAKFLHFLAGMGLGIAPKIGVIAFAGGSLLAAFQGNPVLAALGALAALALYVGIALFARSRMAKKRQNSPMTDADSVDSAHPTAE